VQVSPAVAATARFPLSRYYFLNDDMYENHQNRDRIHSYYCSSYAFMFSTQGCRPRHQKLRRKFGDDDRSQVDPSEGAQNRGEEVHIILSATTMHIMILFSNPSAIVDNIGNFEHVFSSVFNTRMSKYYKKF